MRARMLHITIALVCLAAAASPQRNDAIDAAFAAYWNAQDPKAASKAAERILKTGASFDEIWARLKAGRPYGPEKTGDLSWRYPGPDGAVFDNRIEIPEEYDPRRRWPVRVQLHGGVNRAAIRIDDGPIPSGRGRGRAVNRIPGEPQIYIHPAAWADASWWHTVQVDNILRLLDRVKRRYNVDESRVYLTGISDGGTGVYYMGMRDTTPWSAFLRLNGSIKVLGNPGVGANGNLHVSNLVNKPFFIVNGGRDPLYPVSHVEGHVDVLRQIGVPLVFRPQPNAGHDTSWWPAERAAFEAFVREHPRTPHPDRVSWETDRTDRDNRAHWLVIDALAPRGDASRDELEFLPHPRRSGRVDVARHGNSIDARTRGVASFRLLLSPDVFDFDKPVTVDVNGRRVFDGPVKTDPAVLLEWAARDDDRTMLYGAALVVRVP
jgi:hypothetical protein